MNASVTDTINRRLEHMVTESPCLFKCVVLSQNCDFGLGDFLVLSDVLGLLEDLGEFS